jgi:hypothetical protein
MVSPRILAVLRFTTAGLRKLLVEGRRRQPVPEREVRDPHSGSEHEGVIHDEQSAGAPFDCGWEGAFEIVGSSVRTRRLHRRTLRVGRYVASSGNSKGTVPGRLGQCPASVSVPAAHVAPARLL